MAVMGGMPVRGHRVPDQGVRQPAAREEDAAIEIVEVGAIVAAAAGRHGRLLVVGHPVG
jgi:hypothetical protein